MCFALVFLSLKCETINENVMYNTVVVEIQDKAWWRAGESPVSSNFVCRFAAPPGPILNQLKLCETTSEEQPSGALMCAA